MNWTGGALGRSRNAKTSLTAVQKAHFAKARGRSEATHNSSPSLEIFGNILMNANGNNKAQSRPTRAVSGGSCSNVTNKGFSGKRQSQSTRVHGPKTRRISHSEKPMPRAGPPNHTQNVTLASPVDISSRPSSSVSSLETDAYACPRVYNKPRLPESVNEVFKSAPNAIETHRVRLLKTRDWIGISHTGPARIKFTDSNDRDQIGKRRRLSVLKRHGSQQNPRYHVLRRPQQAILATDEHLTQADISVRIGSAVDRKSTRLEMSRGSTLNPDHTSTMSDEMLLDGFYDCRSASSHNPFCELRSTSQTYSRKRPMTQTRAPASWTFLDGPEGFHDNILGNMTADGYKTFEDNMRPDQVRPSVLQSRTFQESLPMVRKPNGEICPRRIPLEDTPCPQYSNSDRRSVTSGERYFDKIFSNSNSDGEILRQAQRETKKSPALTIEASVGGPTYFDTSPLSRETPNQLAKLRDRDLRSAHNAEKPQEAVALTSSLGKYLSPDRDTTDQDLPELLDLSPSMPLAFDLGDVPEDEKEGWKRFVHKSSEQTGAPIAFPICDATAPVNKIDQHATEDQAVNTKAQDPQGAIDEDEALWRSFVFGTDDPIKDWVIESQEEAEADVKEPNASTAAGTQTSMEAEVATSPIKQNVHFVEEMKNLSSPAAGTNGASHIAVFSSTSQANSDEMLDGGRQQNTSSSLHDFGPTQDNEPSKANPVHPAPSPSAIAPTSTLPLTNINPHISTSHTSISSSLIAQTSTTPMMPAQPSSDELAWSPKRISQSTARPTVIFKKPARYVGKRSYDPVQPVRLGGKTRSKLTGSRKRRKSLKGSARENGKGARIWEIGAEQDDVSEEEDEIEDD